MRGTSAGAHTSPRHVPPPSSVKLLKILWLETKTYIRTNDSVLVANSTHENSVVQKSDIWKGQ